jgi:hypothetical protein
MELVDMEIKAWFILMVAACSVFAHLLALHLAAAYLP